MASNFQRETEHAFITIERDIKERKIPRLVLLCGKEEYLIRWYADMLTDLFVSDVSRAIDLVVLEGEQASVQNIIENTETISLMSERKVVLLPDFAPAWGKLPKGFTEADLQELIAYLSRIPEGSLLLMTAPEQEEEKGGKSKLRKAAESAGKVYDFQPLGEKQLKGFIEKRFKLAGKSYHPGILTTIIGESGYGNKAIDYSLYNLENDLKKIIAHSGDAPEITMADVGDILSANPENNVFAMLDAIGRNRKDEAFRLLHNLLYAGTPVFNLLRLIIGQLELILAVKEMKEEGYTLTNMQKELGAHQFRIKKAMAVTGAYSAEHLRGALTAAYDVDEHIKTGLMDGQLALEFFIAQL